MDVKTHSITCAITRVQMRHYLSRHSLRILGVQQTSGIHKDFFLLSFWFTSRQNSMLSTKMLLRCMVFLQWDKHTNPKSLRIYKANLYFTFAPELIRNGCQVLLFIPGSSILAKSPSQESSPQLIMRMSAVVNETLLLHMTDIWFFDARAKVDTCKQVCCLKFPLDHFPYCITIW